jgi:hypothetical protein
MKFYWNLQELMKFEQEVPICTSMADQLMKRNLETQNCEFLDLVQEVDLNWFEC